MLLCMYSGVYISYMSSSLTLSFCALYMQLDVAGHDSIRVFLITCSLLLIYTLSSLDIHLSYVPPLSDSLAYMSDCCHAIYLLFLLWGCGS